MLRSAPALYVANDRSAFAYSIWFQFLLSSGSVYTTPPRVTTSDHPAGVVVQLESLLPWLVPARQFLLLRAQDNDVLQFGNQLLTWRDEKGTSLVHEIMLMLRDVRAQNVEIPKDDDVLEYLLRFSDIIDVVRVATTIARRRLPQAQLSLEVYHDPEIPDDHLVLYARFQEYNKSVLTAIEDAEDEYLPLLAHKSGWLILTTDFRRPE